MENAGFGNFPERKEINEKEKVFLEIEGQSIEGEKRYFEYPKQVQEETFIKGYTRYKFSKSVFTDIEQRFRTEELHQEAEEAHRKGDYSLRDKLNEKRGKALREQYTLLNDTAKGICLSLSDGRFPAKTYNHTIQGDGSSWDEDNELIKEKIILGEITSISGDYDTLKHRGSGTISAVIDTEGNIVRMGDFMHRKKDNVYKFGEFKGTKYDIKERNDIRLNRRWDEEMTEDEFSTLTKDNIVISTMSGLYLRHGNAWVNLPYSSPTFGFDIEDKIFRNYLDKVNELYSKLPDDVISEKNAESLKHLLADRGNLPIGEVILPIMTGNTGLPALRWGHSKYAIVPTEKNFNFLIIDHVE